VKDFHIPQDRIALTKWWEARHLHHNAVRNTEIALTDAATSHDRKRLYQQMSKPFSSPVVTALRRTDGSLVTITLGLKRNSPRSYLRTLAAPPSDHFQSAHDVDFTDTPMDPHLVHLLASSDEKEVLCNICDSRNDSTSPTIHPTLLRLTTIQSWTVKHRKRKMTSRRTSITTHTTGRTSLPTRSSHVLSVT
jgi:hypothetical protein